MKEPDFLTLAEVLEIHDYQVEKFGGIPGLGDLGLLECALAVPQATCGGHLLHGSLYDIAAAYAFHIAEDQPFLDGNKRTGLAAALVFLDLHGILVADPRGELYDAMIALANHEIEKAALAATFKRLSK